ncbi:MAG TPA: IS1182 family transposase [Candidatus Brocadiia bacterium]|jgi:transposase|nr:IS1182 family transposase [Candidatus Brocadiia bacterium]
MEKTYRPYEPDQLLLLPPALQDWLPEEHVVFFLSDVVDQLDLTAITSVYEQEQRGYPPYHPRMMVKLLLYGYATGVASSRRLAQRCQEDVAFRVLTANNIPDFRTISDFRKRHLAALEALFVQVLRCCQRAGLVQLGTVALDGTKVRANASKHKAMSYGRMQTEVARLEAEVQALLARAERTDAAEDARHGATRRGDELPAELARRTSRLQTIRTAMAALEADAQAAAPPPEQPRRGRPPKAPPGTPPPKAQRNFTDPDSRIMVDGDKAFIQAYNAQAAMAGRHPIIVACAVTNQASDAPHALPLVAAVRRNTCRRPRRVLADAGYWSETNVTALRAAKIEPLIAPGKVKHGPAPPPPRGRIPTTLSLRDRMRRTLTTKRGHALYARRKVLTEPVFGLIKRARGFRQFLLRGLSKVQGEWALICTGHNLLTLFRSGRWAPA